MSTKAEIIHRFIRCLNPLAEKINRKLRRAK